ncbi:carbonic anhydrase [Chitinophaga terrae (ex Kim and Jung 2007)]|uniref:Carbonic anhydrase n=1 Tax=Chitinophaga terrae (ex Kim and Jung 2007) TaxID=408074 RepID=A0A1H4EAT7_9BACT|nr:SulP family inorganic anion transporter [Chitinophaga terrae (ex Kim and Jung 2007)]GEP91511.1 sulfate permease [Chitinophaga terrae (ex Kim and Jung 2007)]SEA82056.1 carbonic anhydrase [Chitinophaga terrae (ex Kim and Jung 2007)]
MNKQTSLFSNIKGDFSAGLVVFLIAVPLCLGIALASGAPLFAGMISGIVGGLVIGFLSGSNLSVSGPAAGLTAVVLVAITKLGAFEVFLLSVVIAGVIQFIMGLLKAGTVANYFPSNVITGMLTAIGIIIILKQIPHAFGYDADSEGDFNFIQVNGDNSFTALLSTLNHINLGATLITIISIFIILYWNKIPKLNVVPAPLVAVLTGILLNSIFSGSSVLALGSNHLVTLPIPESFGDFIHQFTLPDFSAIGNKEVWITAATIAIVASIETLLNVEATDKLDPLKRHTPPNRELKAQGIGNIVSGLIGGLPITSVIVRSSANINAGGRTKLSTMVHGALLLICTALIPGLLNKIPLATLAAVLLVTGYKLCKFSIFKEMFKNGKYQWVPFLVTVVAIVLTDLLVGIALGMAVSVLAILRGNIKSSYYFSKEKYHSGDGIRLELAQEVSFLNKASILLTLDHIPENITLIIDAHKTDYIDFDVLQTIREFKDIKAPQKNIKVILTGFKPVYRIQNTPDLTAEEKSSLQSAPIHTISTGSHKELLKELQLN